MLKKTYLKIKKQIDLIDFSLLWEGFCPIPFALYNDDEVCLNGKIIPKTDEFIANTAIDYNGDIVAIWKLSDNYDLDILTSKIIHEMFHGFQMQNHESRFPNEFEALIKYKYSPGNLSLKLKENKIITNLIKSFNQSQMNELLSIRKRRSIEFPYEYLYEAKVEQIEGSANFVELEALKQISKEKYQIELEKTLNRIIKPSNLLPVRIVSYYIGALFIKLLRDYNISCDYGFLEEPISIQVIDQVKESINGKIISNEVNEKIETYNNETKAIIENALKENKVVLEGEFKLLYINIYNARYYNGYIISSNFFGYEDNKTDKFMYGNFVIQIDEFPNLRKVYQFND